MFDLTAYMEERRATVDGALDAELPSEDAVPAVLHQAMRYAVFTGGKRIRPILCMAACEAICGSPDRARMPAIAIELLHTYTLVHDDLPCMDDDALRRGKPTVHIVFGEANAVLAGDALQTLAFEILAQAPVPPGVPHGQLVLELALAAGSRGVAGGQVLDLADAKPTAKTIDAIHHLKTAALFRAAVRMGAIAGGGASDQLNAFSTYGFCVGMAFQLTDDLLDAPPPDASAPAKPGVNCLAVYAPDEVRNLARRHLETALAALDPLPGGPAKVALSAIAEAILARKT